MNANSGVMSALLREGKGYIRQAGTLMVLVGCIYVFLIVRRFYLRLFDIWILFVGIMCFSFLLLGFQLLRWKKWAAIGGIICSFVDFAVFLYFDVFEPAMWGITLGVLLFEPVWVAVFIVFVAEIVIVLLLALNWSALAAREP